MTKIIIKNINQNVWSLQKFLASDANNYSSEKIVSKMSLRFSPPYCGEKITPNIFSVIKVRKVLSTEDDEEETEDEEEIFYIDDEEKFKHVSKHDENDLEDDGSFYDITDSYFVMRAKDEKKGFTERELMTCIIECFNSNGVDDGNIVIHKVSIKKRQIVLMCSS